MRELDSLHSATAAARLSTSSLSLSLDRESAGLFPATSFSTEPSGSHTSGLPLLCLSLHSSISYIFSSPRTVYFTCKRDARPGKNKNLLFSHPFLSLQWSRLTCFKNYIPPPFFSSSNTSLSIFGSVGFFLGSVWGAGFFFSHAFKTNGSCRRPPFFFSPSLLCIQRGKGSGDCGFYHSLVFLVGN